MNAPALARVNFVRDVKPILENHCVRCHGSEVAMKRVRLNTKQRAMLVVVAKKPDDSLLYTTVKAGIMPPGPRKPSAAELETLRKWIEEGARWPDGVELVGKNPFVTGAGGAPGPKRD
jgi:hypothetical protein